MGNEIPEIVTELADDPLYQLSTAGQEQFHTNMLYWLIKTHPDASGPLMSLFGALPPQPIYRTQVQREWRHLDLFVNSGLGCGKLVLENKLHSLPRVEQLTEYYDDLPTQLRTDETAWVLLSLIRPTFTMPEPWRYVDYSALHAPLTESAEILRDGGNVFEAELVQRYVALVGKLIAVRDQYVGDATQNRPIKLTAFERALLREARLLPLVEKLRMAGLAEAINERLGQDLPVKFGLSNTHGLAEVLLPAPSGHIFGWQYQAGQLRLAVILHDGEGGPWKDRRADRDQYVQQHFSDFFDFTVLRAADTILGPYAGKMTWLGYEPAFVYKYRPIQPDLTADELADACAVLTTHVQLYAESH